MIAVSQNVAPRTAFRVILHPKVWLCSQKVEGAWDAREWEEGERLWGTRGGAWGAVEVVCGRVCEEDGQEGMLYGVGEAAQPPPRWHRTLD